MSRVRVSRRMARQHALVTGPQALDEGLTRAEMRTELRSGRWIRVARDLYRSASAPVTWEQRALAACLCGGGGAVLSHRSAAVLWKIDGFRPGSVEITMPEGHSVRNPVAATVHSSRSMAAGDVTTIRGIPVTAGARTLIDLAAVVGLNELANAVDDALCRRVVSLETLRRRLESLQSRGRSTTPLKRALEVWTPGPPPANVAEMRVVRCLVDHNLPRPELQYVIRDGGRFVARADMAYSWARVAIESQSVRWHDAPRLAGPDRVRLNRMVAAGWKVFQAMPADILRGGHELCAGVVRALAEAA